MISLTYLLIAIGVLVLVMLFFEGRRRFSKRRIWMSFKRIHRCCHMDVTKKEGGVVYSSGGGKGNKLGQVKLNDDDDNIAEIRIIDPEDLSQDDKKMILVGYVTSEGKIYKGANPNLKKQKVYGYTANPDNLLEPSVELRWRRVRGINWIGELNAILGAPPEKEGKDEIDPIAGLINLPTNENSETSADSEKKKDIPKPKVAVTCEVSRISLSEPKSDKTNNNEGNIPDIVRAAAFMLLYKEYAKRDRESLVEMSYGWRDTAFISMIIYTFIYLLFYSIYCAVLEMPFIGQSYEMGVAVAAFYIAFWGVVRQYKIHCIEGGSSFQPTLDMLNSKVGIAPITFVIMAFSVLSIIICFVNGEKNYELLPLQIVVIVGLAVNYSQKGIGISEPWKISDTLHQKKTSDDDDDDDDDENSDNNIVEPKGSITKLYEWELHSVIHKDKVCTGSITMLFDPNKMQELRQSNPFYMQRVDLTISEYVKKMFDFLKSSENKELLQRIRWIAHRIQEQGRRLERGDFIQFVVNFVQDSNIAFCKDQNSKPIDFSVCYIRYPDETLFDKEGDADCKVFLAAMLFYSLGYNVLYMYSTIKKHTVLGVEPKKQNWCEDYFKDYANKENIYVKKDGHTYIVCECSGENTYIGQIANGLGVEEFETRVPLYHRKNASDQTEDIISYNNWKFDGKDLFIDFSFSKDEIASLRSDSPFAAGSEEDQNRQNILAIYKSRFPETLRYLFNEKEEDARNRNIIKLCDALTKFASEISFESMAAYPTDLKLLRLAISFVSDAITNGQDEDNDMLLAIMENSNLKIYVRYPDVLLYDQEGDSDCKSFLAVMILRYLGINSAFLASNVYEQAALGIEFKDEWKDFLDIKDFEHSIKEHNGKKYLFCDMSSGVLGKPDKMSVDNFEVIMEIPAKEKN